MSLDRISNNIALINIPLVIIIGNEIKFHLKVGLDTSDDIIIHFKNETLDRFMVGSIYNKGILSIHKS